MSVSGINILIGVVSFGEGLCTTAQYPGVHSRVASVTEWISRIIGTPGSGIGKISLRI